MEIVFRSPKLQRACSIERESKRQWGAQNAKKIRRRLADLQAAVTLAEVSTLPPVRCHPLQGDRAGQFAVDVQQPYRLIFEPANDPVPRMEDGGIDLTKITRIRILGVEDYHGR
ncbi:MAG: plasmid maintenance system killer protein [Deltaproteobacteria bacterium CSP1-8]|nr:MAG: plasmid maintenance system killer protein [Deltaproteobacteria bacterium CSP1-8]